MWIFPGIHLFFALLVFVSGKPEKELSASTGFRPGKDFAIFIAVKDYNVWNDLRNPIRDANAVAAELRHSYGFDTKVLENPNQTEIYAELEAYAKNDYDHDAQLLIFFSGHGHFKPLSEEGFFIPKDGLSTIDDPFGQTFIPHARLQNIVDAIPCRHILLVIDACFAGTFDGDLVPARNEGQVAKYVEEGLKYKSRLYLTSGGNEYVSDGLDHSPFTRGVLDVLRRDENGIISFSELFAGLDYISPRPMAGEFGGNEPGGNFFFLRDNAYIPYVEKRFERPGARKKGGKQPDQKSTCSWKNTIGASGVKVSFVYSGITYSAVSSNGQISLPIPCDLKGQFMAITLTKPGKRALKGERIRLKDNSLKIFQAYFNN